MTDKGARVGTSEQQWAADDAEDLERTLEDVTLPDGVEGFSKRRVELVARAAREWASALIDLGGRNNLLRYRELRAGTLDLTKASPVAVETLLAGNPVRITALFPDEEERAQQLRRVRVIHNKAKENFEERGVQTLSLGCGLATWNNEGRAAWTPSAPVLLRQASLRPLGAAQDDFELVLLEEMEVNPTLLHVLKVDFDCALPQEELLDRVDGVIDEMWELDETYKWLTERAHRVPAFEIEPRLVLTNFAYAKLPMVRDIEGAFNELVAHELIAAIAGDEEARQAIRDQGPGPDAVPTPDSIPLADEFLVLDADSSQSYAINAVLGGTSLIVRGPPGTGKSQTIANLMASLVARDKKVLFVAEKRAAIDAVLKRLRHEGLEDLVLDLHGGASSRRAFAERVGKALLRTRSVPRFDGRAGQQKVEKRRRDLNSYVEALHERREPWGLSIYEMRAELIGLGDVDADIRLTPKQLDRLDGETISSAENDLREFVQLGGASLPSSDSPWRNAVIRSPTEAQHARACVETLRRDTLPTVVQALARAAAEASLPAPGALDEWEPVVTLWDDLRVTFAHWDSAVWEAEVSDLCGRLEPARGGTLSRMRASMLSPAYKSARAGLRALLREGVALPDRDLLAEAERICEQAARWEELGGTGTPQLPEDDTLTTHLAVLRRDVAEVAALTANDLGEEPGGIAQLLGELVADLSTLLKLPEIDRLRSELRARELDGVLDLACARGLTEASAVTVLRFVWLHSIIDLFVFTESSLATFDAERHDAKVREFQNGDRHHVETTSARIRRAAAENFVRVRQAFPQQDQLLIAQAKLKRRHLPVREVVRKAEDVLLALKPCWAMSPLLVSQLLPAKPMFDVVIFDEASQITPADAVPAIVRGAQLVVAGDDRQLPPTSFFVSETPVEEDDGDEVSEATELAGLGLAGTGGFESILDSLGVILRFRMLRWHYRSRDERLIAFSNAHVYDRQLVTFPGVGGDQVLRYTEAPWEPAGETNSPTAEVEQVVDLVFEHARERPGESLGVIAMGIKHSERIDECLRQRLRDEPRLLAEVGDFFAEDREERFFVKNLERVQGDERDAIILTIGYGKNANGTLPLRFGPLLYDGGERRLNVAITRAKSRLTLVTSFRTDDLDLTKTVAPGIHLLRQYLQYVQSGGASLGDVLLEKPAMNPFEIDVRDALAGRGVKLVPQYGTSGFWIDFVAQHPTIPGKYVLAIECDGATYHASESARDRDRLRQEQLERLGWRFHRIWSSRWFYDKEACVQDVLQAYRDAVERADHASQVAAQRSLTPRESEGTPPTSTLDDVALQVRAAFGTGNAATVSSRPEKGRPPIRRGQSIDEYTDVQLVSLARWIDSGDAIYIDDELVREMMRELGFRRLGSRIDLRLRRIIKKARK